MKTQCYLIVGINGSARVTRHLGKVERNEVALKVSVDIPDTLFRAPVPIVELVVPPDLDGDTISADVVVRQEG